MTKLDAIRARDSEWTDVADSPDLTPLHLSTHEGATHLTRRECEKAAIVDRRSLLEERARIDTAIEDLPVTHGTGTMYVGVEYIERDAVRRLLGLATDGAETP